MKRIDSIMPVHTAYSRKVLQGIARYSRVHGNWRLELQVSWLKLRPPVQEWLCDGLIVQLFSEPLLQAILCAKLPAVNVSDSRDDWGLPTVHPDNVAIGQMGAEHFLKHGFRHLAYCGYSDLAFARQRSEGFRQTASASGLGCSVMTGPQSRLSKGPGGRRLLDWLRSLPKPVGLMACNDVEACAVSNLCQIASVRVPEELAILGVDNDEVMCNFSGMRLSSIDVDAIRIGYEAAALLDRIMAGKRTPKSPVLIPPIGVNVRRSSDLMAVEDPEVARAMRWIRDHVAEPMSVDALAEGIAVSRRKLERGFRKCLGHSPGDEITNVHLDKVKQLLAETALSVERIAELSGFTDAAHLRRWFRRRGELTPHRYRRTMRTSEDGSDLRGRA